MLRLIGYWWSESEPHFPHPARFVDERWDQAERAQVAAYLRAGVEYVHYRGYSHSRMPGGPPDREMGAREFTDGVWAWPEGLVVYVERFAVRPPEEFLAHARANGCRIPSDLDMAALEEADVVDTSWWEAWARSRDDALSRGAPRE